MTERPWLLGLDTATATVVVAAAAPDGEILGAVSFPAEHRHSEWLLPSIEQLIGAAGLARESLAGIVVGSGPGAFTGLRVGLATAKVLAHELALPLVGISTASALLAAGASNGTPDAVLWLPAGSHDRLEAGASAAPRIVHDSDPPALAGTIVAVDLVGRASDDASERGRRAVAGLATSLMTLGAARLGAGETDDPDRLVPAYASLPRGMGPRVDLEGGVAWSRDPR
jgi:tRNA threonylcarbamoyl adenosine modification protein YeaZ